MRNLVAGGDERFDDATSYFSRYELYDEAFRLYADKPESLLVCPVASRGFSKLTYKVVHDLYGDYLYDRREFHHAAICMSQRVDLADNSLYHGAISCQGNEGI